MPFAALLTLASGELARLGFSGPIESPKPPEPEHFLQILDDWTNRRDEMWDLNLSTILGGTYQVLTSGAPGRRLIPALVARGLTAVQDEVQIVQRYIDDPDLNVRLAALRAIGQSAAPSSAPLLTARLEHPDPQIRRAALDALGSFNDESLIPPIEAAAALHPELQEPAARAIRKIRALVSQDMTEMVDAWVESPEYEDLLSIAGLVRDELIAVVLDHGRGEAVRTRAARLLAVRGGPPAIKRIGGIADNRDEPIALRVQVIDGIGRFYYTPAYPILLRFLDEDAPELQRAAIRALGWMQVRQAGPILAGRYNMEGDAFVPEIRVALWRIFRSSGRDLLQAALRLNQDIGIESIQIIEDEFLYRSYKQVVRRRLVSSNTDDRLDAILLLAFAGDVDDIRPLEALSLEDPDTVIRELAALAARKLTTIHGEP